MKKHFNLNSVCKRKTDGVLFRPSYPSNLTRGEVIAACILGKRNFYFRRIKPVKKWFTRYFEDTGEIWEPESGEFDIIKDKKSIAQLFCTFNQTYCI